MAKYDYDVIEVPDGVTLTQVKNGLKAKGSEGWELVQIIKKGTKDFVIFKKSLAR